MDVELCTYTLPKADPAAKQFELADMLTAVDEIRRLTGRPDVPPFCISDEDLRHASNINSTGDFTLITLAGVRLTRVFDRWYSDTHPLVKMLNGERRESWLTL